MDQTYGDICEFIAKIFNKTKCQVELTGDDIFHLHPDGELFWLEYLYEVCQKGTSNLEGLLVSDPFYAKMFVKKIESKL